MLKLGWVAHSFTFRTQETEAGGLTRAMPDWVQQGFQWYVCYLLVMSAGHSMITRKFLF